MPDEEQKISLRRFGLNYSRNFFSFMKKSKFYFIKDCKYRICLILSLDFPEFREDTYSQRLFLLQEAILQRFGFVPCQMENSENDHQYVHITGNVFILVPSMVSTRPRPRAGTSVVRRTAAGQKRYPVHPDQPSPHEAYITRHVSGKNKDDYSMDRRVSKSRQSTKSSHENASLKKVRFSHSDGIPVVLESHGEPQVEITLYVGGWRAVSEEIHPGFPSFLLEWR